MQNSLDFISLFFFVLLAHTQKKWVKCKKINVYEIQCASVKTYSFWLLVEPEMSCFLLLRMPDLGYDFDKNEGKPFCYFTYGVASSEVEIDCLTGDHKVSGIDG